MSYQKIIIVGSLGAEPVSKVTPQGKAVSQFNVAVNDTKDLVTWFKVVAFEGQAENCNKYLHKGSKVLVEGRLKFDKYTDKNGLEKKGHSVVASQVKFLSSKAESQAEPFAQMPSSEESKQQNFGMLKSKEVSKAELPFDDDSDFIPF